MKTTRVDDDGNVRCPKCGAAGAFTSKRSGKGKVFAGVFAPKRLQCQGCGTYLRPQARPGQKPAPAAGAKKCRHGVRRDICALCGNTEKVKP
jgi:predicted RNA-binding Zn-ribbon protein involved in translation (DUF1610 family)